MDLIEANATLPGTATNAARLHVVPAIGGPELVDTLCSMAGSGRFDHERPVLFLTNDHMVGQVAREWMKLAPYYRLSWSGSKDEVLRLLEKSEHEAASQRASCLYPRGTVIEDLGNAESLSRNLPYPVIVKPSRPLSAFKVRVAGSVQDFLAVCSQFGDSMPFVVQPYIPGGDDQIRFTAFYLRNGEPLARFEGRKLQSRPMGHTTIAEAYPDTGATDAALRFFRASGLSGPASLEVKKDDKGRYWVIEPTVGRTNFWLQLCVSNGVNLPWLEYCNVVGLPCDAPDPMDKTVWLNSDRDRAVLARYVGMVLRGRARVRPLRFSYLCWKDPLPFLAATRRNVLELTHRAWRRAKRTV